MATIPPRSELTRMRKADLVALLDALRAEVGPIALEVRQALAEIEGMEGFDRPRGAAALHLATYLDTGAAGLATAGIAKELRATLADLEQAAKERNDADGDPAEDFDTELARLTAV